MTIADLIYHHGNQFWIWSAMVCMTFYFSFRKMPTVDEIKARSEATAESIRMQGRREIAVKGVESLVRNAFDSFKGGEHE